MIDMDNFAAYGTAMSNIKAMSGTIQHTEDVDAVLKLIEARIDFLNSLPDSELYKGKADATAELCVMRMMILAMCGEVEFVEDGEDEQREDVQG